MLSAASRLWSLARPKVGVFVALLPLAAYGYGLWERGSVRPIDVAAPDLLALAMTWFLGHAGSLWLNAELDRDEGGVLLGRAVPVPRGTAVAGYLALLGAVLLGLTLHPGTAVSVFGCAVLAVLYSHPRVALKGHAWAGPAINVLGYGALSTAGGYLASGGRPDVRTALSLTLVLLLIAAAYLAAQAWQEDEDRARGYRTFVVLHGARRTLLAARGTFRAAILGFAWMTLLGAYPRVLLLALPLFLWADRWFARWLGVPRGGSPRHATVLMQRLVLACLTVLLLVYGHHAWQLAHGLPPGGRGTVWGAPAVSAPPK